MNDMLLKPGALESREGVVYVPFIEDEYVGYTVIHKDHSIRRVTLRPMLDLNGQAGAADVEVWLDHEREHSVDASQYMTVIPIAELTFEYRKLQGSLAPGFYHVERHLAGVPFTDYIHTPDGIGLVWYDDPEFNSISQ